MTVPIKKYKLQKITKGHALRTGFDAKQTTEVNIKHIASCAGIQKSLPNVKNVFVAVIQHFNHTILPAMIGLAAL